MEESEPSGSIKRKAEEDDFIISVKDIAKLQQLETEQANAILGGSDENDCSYPKGYVKRQALYACLTCIPESKEDLTKCAGVCLACYINCHDGHDVVELYTKRNFRCDCGNSKFSTFICTLQPDKDLTNELNKYNQNFSGLYCTCKRPYPDEENEDDTDTMVQCIICEDWYHTRHLGVEVTTEDYAELTCENCVKKHPFLAYYDHLCIDNESNEKIDVVTDDSSVKEPEEERPEDCKMPKIKSKLCAKFWTEESWREQLCTCAVCQKMYEDQEISFITDVQDTLHAYEKLGKINILEKEKQLDEETVKLLNSLDRVRLLETLSAFNEFKESLGEYLQEFKGDVFRVENVKDFIEKFKAKKKPKFEQQYYCR